MFWFVRLKFQYAASVSDPSQRLLETLRHDKWQRISHKITPTQAVLEHRLPVFFRNSWNPIFDGSFVTEAGRRYLVGYFRINWLVLAFTVMFVAFAAYSAWSTMQQPAIRPGYVANWKAARLHFDLTFLGMAIGINLLGWLIGLPYERRILTAIRESATP
jgi:hypothetical protein